jgi:autotransporter strand-loop-strand O-heptosyltransferase
MTPNMWTKLSREYYTDWTIKVFDRNMLIYVYKFNLKNQKVFITFESSSLGDSIAWIPYVLEFKNKHNCEVVVSTFWNKLFKKSYPEITFTEPGQNVNNLLAMYKIGWFYDLSKEPVLPSTIPLQKSATNILGLDFKEIKPTIDFIPGRRPFTEKYITIANESTAGLKLWNNPTGWQELTDYLISKGFKVINVAKNGGDIKNVTKIKDTSIENTMNYIHHSEFFIGLSSGLSWLAWGINKHVVMISNFTEEDHEFNTNCTRIVNHSVCNSCWNNSNFKFDKGDWNWCPEHKDTPRHFECHKSITSQMVIDKIQNLL